MIAPAEAVTRTVYFGRWDRRGEPPDCVLYRRSQESIRPIPGDLIFGQSCVGFSFGSAQRHDHDPNQPEGQQR